MIRTEVATNLFCTVLLLTCSGTPSGLPPAIGYGRGGHYMPRDYHHGHFRGQHLAFGSQYMDAEEIDSILRIQWKSLHSGSPYAEDYYYLVGS